jgi:hypothetical protein
MLQASKCTMYNSGHTGAETVFGECCEKWGVKETIYTFEGHFLNRNKNIVALNNAELRRGDISIEIVSLHMHRHYSQSDMIRKVFQTIFHMVNNGSQIFAVGVIHDDNTVKGGTGWAVELGKFFNRSVHVFDKSKNKWYTWRRVEWVEDVPVIAEPTFCGTGTREMTASATAAVEALFERSFGGKR